MSPLESVLRGARLGRKPWGKDAELERAVLEAQRLELVEVIHAVACLAREGQVCACVGGPALELTQQGLLYLERLDVARARAQRDP